jgi:Glu/Leu/Phe/Val dehydrogenase, dimerisation domain
MEQPFTFADDLGPEKIVYIYEPRVGLHAILVIDNTAAGPAIGGTRMGEDVSAEECFRLARAMTFKNSAAALPHGGAKSVIFGDPSMPAADKERLVRDLRRRHPPSHRVHSRPGHGNKRDRHGLDQGRDRALRRSAARAGRHPSMKSARRATA